MRKPTQLIALTGLTCLGGLQFSMAQTSPFEVSSNAVSTHKDAYAACNSAFIKAEDKALNEIKQHFTINNSNPHYVALLIRQNEQRTLTDAGLTSCRFEGTWRAEISKTLKIGSEQAIDGNYISYCADERKGDVCWFDIVDQAKADLYDTLDQQYANSPAYRLVYRDFSGSQRDSYTNGQLKMTANGTFYFDVVSARSETPAKVKIQPYAPRPKTSARKIVPYQPEKVAVKEQEKPLSFTLSFTFDGNEEASADDLAISSNRFGMGIWHQNRIGAGLFIGEDTVGIANSNDNVKNDGSYDTFGLGIGYRMFDDNRFTIENMLYYVNTEDYSTTVDPDNCSTCTSTSFESEDYLQATINFKTNMSPGINVGWMFTWKFLDQEGVDQLSSGLYLEAQF
ncbi:hypothetical protein [Reinekea marinisedimentorum]|uniref:Uncharacterized protein n=1 Tax=Reinekea marinisedimentorum TaxID=230495 RepID=A0A4R3I3D3_9GAMM|nr:hypothetical protein [Reinekea marinisedimentorum]TCS40325.1 hypothetical protein BCF53_10934 [Reinekea marinisedimentorum]